MLGSFACKVEWESMRAGPQCTRTGRNFFRTQDRRGVRGLGKIRIATLNIKSGRERGMEATLKELYQGNVDVGVLQEMKLTDRIHMR